MKNRFCNELLYSRAGPGDKVGQESAASSTVRRTTQLIGKGLRMMADLAWPVTCVGCGKWNDSAWCEGCRAASEGPTITRTLSPSGITVYAATEYDGPITHAITAYKDEGRRDSAYQLVRLLRRACAEAIAQAPPEIDTWYVVTVPSSSVSIRRRGFAPLDELAAQIVTGGPRWGPRLQVVRQVADQSHLGRSGRAINVDGAFEVASRWQQPPGSGLLVLDDVVTSGATMNAAFSALRETNFAHLVGVTIASTPLKLGKFE